MTAMLELEEKDIELQLQEIQLKRRQLEIEREQLANKNQICLDVPKEPESNVGKELHLHYSNSVKENHMRIADVCPDGSIMIRHGKDTVTISKKYSLKTLYWIKQKLPSWIVMQRKESNFWMKLASKYSRRFLNGDTISHTTMEKLCYIVDSGEVDVWFEKYEGFKDEQSRLPVSKFPPAVRFA